MFTRAPQGADMIDDFRPMMTTERVQNVQGYFVTMGAAEGQLRTAALPPDRGVRCRPAAYAAIEQFSADWPRSSSTSTRWSRRWRQPRQLRGGGCAAVLRSVPVVLRRAGRCSSPLRRSSPCERRPRCTQPPSPPPEKGAHHANPPAPNCRAPCAVLSRRCRPARHDAPAATTSTSSDTTAVRAADTRPPGDDGGHRHDRGGRDHRRRRDHGAPDDRRRTASFEGELVGTFSIDSAVRSADVWSGSYFQMVQPGGTVEAGPFVPNADSTCSDPNYTALMPGTDGGLVTGAFQPAPEPAYDDAGNALAAAIFEPVPFFAVAFAVGPTRPRRPPPSPRPTVCCPATCRRSPRTTAGELQPGCAQARRFG